MPAEFNSFSFIYVFLQACGKEQTKTLSLHPGHFLMSRSRHEISVVTVHLRVLHVATNLCQPS